MIKQTRLAVGLFAIITFLSACKKEWNEMGSQLINEEDVIVLSFDSLAIKTSIIKEDSLVTLNAATSHLGSIMDADFGASQAAVYTEFRIPSSDVVFGDEAIADSLVLSLDLADYYGDTTTVLNLSIVEMLEQIETSSTSSSGEDSTIRIYANQDFAVDDVVLASKTVSIEPSTETLINIPLSIDFAQYLLDAEQSNFTDNDAFQSFFAGLYISAQEVFDGGLLLELDLLSESSKLTLYYHNSDSDSASYDFQINSNADRMTRWAHDYAGTDIESSFDMEDLDLGYLQGGVGIRTYLDMSAIQSLKDSNYIIHQAELFLPYISRTTDDIYPSPEKLGLAGVTIDGGLEVLAPDQNGQGSAYFDGNRDELQQYYKFNIARYVHDLVYENYSSTLGLYVPSSIVQPERVILNNYNSDSTGVRLKLLVSEI